MRLEEIKVDYRGRIYEVGKSNQSIIESATSPLSVAIVVPDSIIEPKKGRSRSRGLLNHTNPALTSVRIRDLFDWNREEGRGLQPKARPETG
jgi:hypothetical protein